jgi:hypothetical protein
MFDVSSAELTSPIPSQSIIAGQWPEAGLDTFNSPTPCMDRPFCSEGASLDQANTPATFPTDNEVPTPTRRSPVCEASISGDSGGRYYRCECGHRTARKGDMVRHHESLLHSQKRKYQCSCGAEFTRRFGLRRHQAKCKKRSARPVPTLTLALFAREFCDEFCVSFSKFAHCLSIIYLLVVC